MSISDSESSSVTSSMADELSSVAFKAPLQTPDASDLSDPPNAGRKNRTRERDAEDNSDAAVDGACSADTTEPVRVSVVHVDEIWDKEKRRYMTFTPTEDTLPTPAQQQCVLLVRHMHPRDIRQNIRTTVEVKRPGLRMLLGKLFSGANAFTWGDRHDLDPKWFFWARSRLHALRQFCLETDQQQIASEIEAALDFCRSHYAKSLASIDALRAQNRVRFKDLWTIFASNTLVTGRDKLGHPRVWTVDDGWKVEYGPDKGRYQIEVHYAESDGKHFGWARDTILIEPFSGARLLDHLLAQPLHLMPKRDAIGNSLRSRAAAQQQLHEVSYSLRHYVGHGLVMDEKPDGEIELKKRHFRGKIMLDPEKTFEVNPENLIPQVYEFAAADYEHHECVVDEPDGRIFLPEEMLIGYHCQDEEDELETKRGSIAIFIDDDELSVPAFNIRPSRTQPRQQQDVLRVDKPLSNFQKLLLSGLVYGYDLKFGYWGAFSVSLVQEFSWNDTAFDALVMETKLKTRLGSLVKAYGKKATDVSGFDDFITEKGRGLIGLLFGKPGLGKTFTAEAIAEMARLPLMTVSAGSLGSEPDTIEENLRATLDLAARWRAVVLFDEADVFLAKRDSSNIERNAVVSVFLRELEYFPGIMLLTTNQKDLIDEAFQSRIHFCHSYPELDFQARVKIWKEFVMRTQNQTDLRVDINNKGYERLAREKYNGREIKNIMSMASTSALDRTPPILTTDDILEISRTLQNWDAVSVEDRSSGTTPTAVQNTKPSVFAHMPDRGDQIASISTIKSVGTWLLVGILAVGMMHNVLLQLVSAYRRDQDVSA